MTKQKIAVDQKFILNSSYEKYKYLTEYMVHGQTVITTYLESVTILSMHISPLLLTIQQS